jgi:hypothetical protein
MDVKNEHEDWEKDAPKLLGIEKKNPFTIPTDYFESLPASIEARIITERLKESIMSDGFTVPEDYFTDLEKTTINRISADDVKPQYRIKAKKTRFTRIQFAAAACVTLAVCVAIFLNTRSNSFTTQLNTIPESEIVNYLQLTVDASDTPVIIENLGSSAEFINLNKDLEPEDIELYINSTNL